MPACPILDRLTRGQIEILGYVGILTPPGREPIMLLSIKCREERKVLRCTMSRFHNKEQDGLRWELGFCLTKNEWSDIRRYGFYWH